MAEDDGVGVLAENDGVAVKRRKVEEETSTWTCPVCLEETPNDTKCEALTLSCGHKLHLSCWLPCVLPVAGEDSAQARFVEDRLGRKCPTCRGEFSGELQDTLKERRLLIRSVRQDRQQQTRDLALQRVLAVLAGRGWAAELPGSDVIAPDLTRERLPLDAGDVLTALAHPVGLDGDAPRQLANAMRAELQMHGLSPSGTGETLAGRLLEAGQATRGFFLTLKKKNLLTRAQPLRDLIDKELARIEGAPPPPRAAAAAIPPQRPPAAAPPAASPPAAFSAANVAAALGAALAALPPAAPGANNNSAPEEEEEDDEEPPADRWAAQLETLSQMGFPRATALQALRAADGDVNAAIGIAVNI